jgi:hypothetical protein
VNSYDSLTSHKTITFIETESNCNKIAGF